MSIIQHDLTLYGGNDAYQIVLRPLSDEHLPYLYQWNADPEVLIGRKETTSSAIPPRRYAGFTEKYRKTAFAF